MLEPAKLGERGNVHRAVHVRGIGQQALALLHRRAHADARQDAHAGVLLLHGQPLVGGVEEEDDTEWRRAGMIHEEAPDQVPPVAEPTRSPAEQDLETLREQYDTQRPLVEVAGHTEDAAALHAFVARLNETRIFEFAKLQSLETRRSEAGSQFVIRVLVRAGYGQADGPATPPPDVVAVTMRSEAL